MCLCGMLAAEIAGLPDAVAAEARRFFHLNLDWLETVLSRGDDAVTTPDGESGRDRAFFGDCDARRGADPRSGLSATWSRSTGPHGPSPAAWIPVVKARADGGSGTERYGAVRNSGCRGWPQLPRAVGVADPAEPVELEDHGAVAVVEAHPVGVAGRCGRRRRRTGCGRTGGPARFRSAECCSPGCRRPRRRRPSGHGNPRTPVAGSADNRSAPGRQSPVQLSWFRHHPVAARRATYAVHRHRHGAASPERTGAAMMEMVGGS